MWIEWPMESRGLVVVTVAALLLLLLLLVACSSWLGRLRFSLDGRVVVVTGGARGIGRRLAETILRRASGVTLVLLDVDGDALAHTQRELKEELQLAQASERATGRTSPHRAAADSKVLIFKCDVSKERDVAVCVEEISQAVAPKKISVLVNNAGVVNGRSIDELSSADVRRTFEVNTLGQIWMLQAILPLLKQSQPEEGALVVSVASVMGLISGANLADYCASKAAVSAFHDCLRLELWRDKFSHIRTLLVCPNAVDTGMFEGIMQGSDFTAWLSRLLLPASSESDAAERIFLAMVKGEQFVVSCYGGWRGFVVPWLPSVARLLPVSLFDRVVFLGGGVHGMDTFTGKKRKQQ